MLFSPLFLKLIIYLFIHEKNTVRAFTTDLLQRKVKGLEDDNRKLRAEASQLASESSETELREEQLLHQVVAQLGIIQLNVSRISVVSQSRPIFKISLLAPFPVANLSFGHLFYLCCHFHSFRSRHWNISTRQLKPITTSKIWMKN